MRLSEILAWAALAAAVALTATQCAGGHVRLRLRSEPARFYTPPSVTVPIPAPKGGFEI